MFHDWTRWMNLTCCKKCMMVKSKKNEFGICKGSVKVGLREEDFPS